MQELSPRQRRPLQLQMPAPCLLVTLLHVAFSPWPHRCNNVPIILTTSYAASRCYWATDSLTSATAAHWFSYPATVL